MTQSVLQTDQQMTRRLIFIGIGWHIILSILSLAGFVILILGKVELRVPSWLLWVAVIILFSAGVSSAAASYFLLKGKRTGRTISLVVNYLGFVIFLIALLNGLGAFLGVDSLANTFGRGLIPLGGVFVGYLITALGDKFHSKITIEEWIKRVGKIIIGISFAIFLISVGLFSAISSTFQRMIRPANLIILFFCLLFAVMIWIIWREKAAIQLHRTNSQTEALEGYLFLSPNLLGFLVFFAFPLVFSFFISLTDWDAFGNANFVGLANYAKLFTIGIAKLATPDQVFTEVLNGSVFSELFKVNLFNQSYVVGAADPLFWISLRNTLVFGIVTVPLSAIPALFLANILNSKIPGMKFYRAVYFLPSIAATVGISLIWQWLYNATIGYINYFLTLGVQFWNGLFATGFDPVQIRWLSESKTALLAIIIVSAWQTMGFNTVLFMAGLQNIPKELYEAATVDGAGRWDKFWRVTLPLLAPTTFFVITTTTIQALQVFEQVFIMTNPPGSPGTSTLTIVLYLYQNGFQRFRQGYGAAIAWVLFIVIFAVTLLQFRSQRKSGAYEG